MCITIRELWLPQRRLVREHCRQLLVSLRSGIQRQSLPARTFVTCSLFFFVWLLGLTHDQISLPWSRTLAEQRVQLTNNAHAFMSWLKRNKSRSRFQKKNQPKDQVQLLRQQLATTAVVYRRAPPPSSVSSSPLPCLALSSLRSAIALARSARRRQSCSSLSRTPLVVLAIMPIMTMLTVKAQCGR